MARIKRAYNDQSEKYYMNVIITWLVTSRAGRAIGAISAAALTLILVVLRAFSAGKRAARAAQTQKTLQDVLTRNQINDDVEKMSFNERRSALRGWVRGDDDK